MSALCFSGMGCTSDTKNFSFQLPEKNTHWQAIDEDLIYREFVLSSPKKDIETIVYKFDSSDFISSIEHNQPKRFTEWASELNSNLLINGGFFNEMNNPTGWLVIDGQTIGDNQYSPDASGMLFIKDGKIDILDSAIPSSIRVTSTISIMQSFPVIIHKGGLPGIEEDSEKIARRTILAKDKIGNFLIIIVDQTPVSLYNLMQGLLASDLDIDIALNLDGGPSTGLIANSNNHQKSIIPLTPLPQVVSFLKRPQVQLHDQ